MGRTFTWRASGLSLAGVAGFTIVRACKALDWRPERAIMQGFERVAARHGVERGLATFRKT
jgi:hypothetical protein